MTVAVRRGKLTDISDILAFAKRKLESTNYQAFPFNAVIARRTVKGAMTRPDSRLWVAERDGKITGFLIGEVGTMPFTHRESATDLAFLADAGGLRLLLAFVDWCKMLNVGRIDMGVSATRYRRAMDRLFGSAGLQRSGGMYYANFIEGSSDG